MDKSLKFMVIGSLIAIFSLYWLPVSFITFLVQAIIGFAFCTYAIHLVTNDK